MTEKEECYRIQYLQCPECNANIRYCDYHNKIIDNDNSGCESCIIYKENKK